MPESLMTSPPTAATVIGAPAVPVVTTPETGRIDSADRLTPLDGWRGISILAVVAAHMLPLGPKSWQLNEAAGLLGMSLFFTLSGFLITSMLYKHMDIRAFFIRRACRILPLALLYITIALFIIGAPAKTFLAHYLFAITYWDPVSNMNDLTGHLWSVCVEIHFYIFIGLLCLIFRRAAFYMLPILCLAVTINHMLIPRKPEDPYYSIVTHLRVDEILAGACLALVYLRFIKFGSQKILSLALLQPILLILLLLACHKATGPFNYARPYLAAALVGSSLFIPNLLQRFLKIKILAYIAAISYAVYIFHPLSHYGWLGDGTTLEKYAKRPLCFLITWILAHLSTFYFEKWWIAKGKKWSTDKRKEVTTQPV
jgi:peptidoglycan/LPS O-acetylase OafA/YrhL